MIILLLIYFFFLSPLLATDADLDSSFYQNRALKEEEVIRRFNTEIDTALGIKEDAFERILKELQTKRFKFKSFSHFNDELESLLRFHLLSPEKLLEQYRETGPQPLVEVIGMLKSFIERWRESAACAKGIEIPINITNDFKDEWQEFAFTLAKKLEAGQLEESDLKNIYMLIANTFFKWPSDLKKSFEHMSQYWKNDLPSCLSFLQEVKEELEYVFQTKGRVLWDILMHELLKRNVDISEFPSDYSSLDPLYFSGNNNAVYKALYQESLPSPVIRERKNNNSNILPQNPQLLIAKLKETFESSRSLTEGVKAFDMPTQVLLHANFITATLETLLEFYKSFQGEIKTSSIYESVPWENIAPKVKISRFYEPNGQVMQSAATDACGIERYGPVCFNMPQQPNSSTIRNSVVGGNIIFRSVQVNLPGDMGSKSIMFLLEHLFGITSSAPSVLVAMNNIRFLSSNPSSTQGKFTTYPRVPNVINEYFKAPEKWHEHARSGFVIAERKATSLTLGEFLNHTHTGQLSLKDLDPFSFGAEYLFSLLTGSSRPLESYRVVKNDSGRYCFERAGPSDLMAPLFQRENDTSYRFIGRNCLPFFLHIMKEPIPEKVKEAFLKNNIYILLPYWLKGLTGIQEFYTNLTAHYGLDVLHNMSSVLGINITEAEMLGLSTSVRPRTIVKMIQNFLTISATLSRSNVTYQEVFECINPQEAHCIRLILNNTLQSATKRKEAIVFFEKIIPENIKQLKLTTPRLIARGERVRYSLEDLDLFLKVAQGCCEEAQSIVETSFEVLISNVPRSAKEFFKQKYEWWVKDRRGPEANIIINAWKLLNSDQGRIQLEPPNFDSDIRSPNFNIVACPRESLSEYCRGCASE